MQRQSSGFSSSRFCRVEVGEVRSHLGLRRKMNSQSPATVSSPIFQDYPPRSKQPIGNHGRKFLRRKKSKYKRLLTYHLTLVTHVWKNGQEGTASHITQLEAVTRELCLKVWPSPGPGPGLPKTEHAVAAKGHWNELC